MHLHKFGSSGGAGGATSMRRLNDALRSVGIDSKILCISETPESDGVASCPPSFWERALNKATRAPTSSAGLEDVLNVNHWRVLRHPVFQAADIVHFHRVPDVVSYLSLARLTRAKPGVFSPGEMWAVTGHCRYSEDCERWQTGCGSCPRMDAAPRIRVDGTALQWRLKRWVYRRSNLSVVAKTRWMLDVLKRSILSEHPLSLIPNLLDTELFAPLDQTHARDLLGLPRDKRVILCAAKDLTKLVKGMDLLVDAVGGMPKDVKASILLLTMGRNGERAVEGLDVASRHLGCVADTDTKIAAYSAADVLALPSRAELFGNVVLESAACATPAVAFAVGGVGDIVTDGTTGLLAVPGSPTDLGRRLLDAVTTKDVARRMGEAARRQAVERFSVARVVDQYVKLYREQLTVWERTHVAAQTFQH